MFKSVTLCVSVIMLNVTHVTLSELSPLETPAQGAPTGPWAGPAPQRSQAHPGLRWRESGVLLTAVTTDGQPLGGSQAGHGDIFSLSGGQGCSLPCDSVTSWFGNTERTSPCDRREHEPVSVTQAPPAQGTPSGPGRGYCGSVYGHAQGVSGTTEAACPCGPTTEHPQCANKSLLCSFSCRSTS